MRFSEFYEDSNKMAAAASALRPLDFNAAFKQYKDMILMAAGKAELDSVTIFRGFRTDGQCFLLNPTSWDRKSANTENFSNLIFNNSQRWAAYPKRKIICSVSQSTASNYGTTFVVVPLDANAKVGICPRYDMWPSFKGNYDVADMNLYIKRAFKAYEITPRDDSWEHFKADCALLREKIGDDPENSILDYNIPGAVQQAMSGDFVGWLENYYDPAANDFKVTTWHGMHNGQAGNRNEVWLDTPCLLIAFKTWANNRARWVQMAMGDDEDDEDFGEIESPKVKVPVTGFENWKQQVKDVHMNEYLDSDWLNFEKKDNIARATTHDGSEVIGEFDIAADKGWFMRDA